MCSFASFAGWDFASLSGPGLGPDSGEGEGEDEEEERYD